MKKTKSSIPFLDHLDSLLSKGDESERIYAVYDMADTKEPAAASRLASHLLVERSQAVREAIVSSLMNIDCSMVYDILFGMFLLPDAYLRNAAVTIFGSNDEDAVAYLSAKLDHADKEARKLILDAMMEIGSPESVFAIRAALHDDCENVRITAVEYLGMLGDKGSIDEMMDLYGRDEEPMLRVAIMETLLLIENASAIRKIIRHCLSEVTDSDAAGLYLPQMLRMAARAGDIEDLESIIHSIEDLGVYMGDVINVLEEAKRRFKREPMPQGLCDLISMVVEKALGNLPLKDAHLYGILQLLKDGETPEIKALLARVRKSVTDAFISREIGKEDLIDNG